LHLEKVFELFDTFVGEGHDTIFADAVDYDDPLMRFIAKADNDTLSLENNLTSE
jgi:hypothetical protein